MSTYCPCSPENVPILDYNSKEDAKSPEIDTIMESNINELVKILSNFEANSTLTLLKPILTNKSLVKWRSGFDSLPSSDFSQSVKIHPL